MFARGIVLALVSAGATLVEGITDGTGISRGPAITPAPVGDACPAGCGYPGNRLCVEDKAVISGVTTRLTYLCAPPAQTVHVTETVLVTVHDSVQQPSVTPIHDSVKQPPVTPTARTVEDTTTTVFTRTPTAFVTQTLHGKPSTGANFTSSTVLVSFSVPPVVPPKSSHVLTISHSASTSHVDPHFVARPSTGTSGWILTNPHHPPISSGTGGIWHNTTSTKGSVVTTTSSVQSIMTIHPSHSVPAVSSSSKVSVGRPKPSPVPGIPSFVTESFGTALSQVAHSMVASQGLPPIGHPKPTMPSSMVISSGNSTKTITVSKIVSPSPVSNLESFPTIVPDHTSTVGYTSRTASVSTITDMEVFPTIVSETGFISLPPDSDIFSSIFDGEPDTAVLTDGTFVSSAPALTTAPYVIVARDHGKADVNSTAAQIITTTIIEETETPTAAYPGASTEALKGVAGRSGPAFALASVLSILVVAVMF